MGTTSANGAVTALSVTASLMVDLVRRSLEEASAAGPLTPESLRGCWYELPLEDLAEGIMACAKPPTHLPLAERKAAPGRMAELLEKRYDELIDNPVIGDASLVSERVAAQLVMDLADHGTSLYLGFATSSSKRYWDTRRDPDGRITVGNTPAGRRRRSTYEELTHHDLMTAYDAKENVRHRVVNLAVSGGAHRRVARTTRLSCGLSGPNVQHLMSEVSIRRYGRRLPGAVMSITQWEGDTSRRAADGTAIQPNAFPRSWSLLQEALRLPADLDDGPLVRKVQFA